MRNAIHGCLWLVALLRCCFLCIDWTTQFFCGAICRGSSRSVLVLELGVCGGGEKGQAVVYQ